MLKTNTNNINAAFMITVFVTIWYFFFLYIQNNPEVSFVLLENYKLNHELNVTLSESQKISQQIVSLEEELKKLTAENEALFNEKLWLIENNSFLSEMNLMLRSMTILNHGDRNSDKVAITIDDGANIALINQALDYLKKNQVKATFFPMGIWVKEEPEIWQKVVSEGHELGNHTYNHSYLTNLTEDQISQELDSWQEIIDQILGYHYETLYFRPPGMAGYTEGYEKMSFYQRIVAEKGMVTILWDLETLSSLRNKQYNVTTVTEHILSNAQGGSIILLHPTIPDIDALPNIIMGLRRKGLEPVTLTELFLN